MTGGRPDGGEEGPGPLVVIVTGEASGDIIGARLMAALKRLTGGRIRFDGIGGPRMAGEGLASRVPLSALSLFGVVEVLPKALGILRLVRRMAKVIHDAAPAAVVTVDSSGFTFRLAGRLRAAGFRSPMVHYVAPQLWAWWRPSKADALRRHYDGLLALFPFEPPFFAGHGIGCRFVGHPAVEEGFEAADGAAFRRRHGIDPAAPVLVVLPGSRPSEVARLLPPFAATVRIAAAALPGLVVVVPTVPVVSERVAAAVGEWPVRSIVVTDRAEAPAAFRAATAALAASGTVTLELALAGTPFVVGYAVNLLTAWMVRRRVQVRFATVVNLVLDRAAVPELLQEECRPDRLAAALVPLLSDPEARAAQCRDLRDAVGRLGLEGTPPSERAARAVLEAIAAGASGRP